MARTPQAPTSPNGFGSRLRALRESNNLTRPELAERLGWSVSRLVYYESGKTEPTLGELVSLANIFAADPRWLGFGHPHTGSTALLDRPGVTWLAHIEGGDALPIPTSFLEGMLGPLQCWVAPRAGLGMSRGDIAIVRLGVSPVVGQAWLLADAAGGHLQTGWIVEATTRTVGVRLCLTGPVQKLPVRQLVGHIVATLLRAHD